MQPIADLIVAERFRLVRMLGRGGMGSVWLAQHLGLDIPCAVKFIEGEYAAVPEAQARFEREAKAAAALRSPHVVQILDHGIWQGTPYIAMELLDGEDLGKRLQRLGRMPPERRLIASSRRSAARSRRRTRPASSTATSSPTTSSSCATTTARSPRSSTSASPSRATVARGRSNQDRRDARHALLHEPRAGAGDQGGRLPQRSLVARGHRVPGAHRQAALRERGARRPAREDHRGADAGAVAGRAGLPVAFDRWWAQGRRRDPTGRFQSAKEFGDVARARLRALAGDRRDGPRGPARRDGEQSRDRRGGASEHSGYGMGNTPQPVSRVASTVATPQPHGTPQPYAQASLPEAITGAPMARTSASRRRSPGSAPG